MTWLILLHFARNFADKNLTLKIYESCIHFTRYAQVIILIVLLTLTVLQTNNYLYLAALNNCSFFLIIFSSQPFTCTSTVLFIEQDLHVNIGLVYEPFFYQFWFPAV